MTSGEKAIVREASIAPKRRFVLTRQKWTYDLLMVLSLSLGLGIGILYAWLMPTIESQALYIGFGLLISFLPVAVLTHFIQRSGNRYISWSSSASKAEPATTAPAKPSNPA